MSFDYQFYQFYEPANYNISLPSSIIRYSNLKAEITNQRKMEPENNTGTGAPHEHFRRPSNNSHLQKRFEVKKWTAVALWSWDIEVENCAICKSHVMEQCIDCQANQNAQTAKECTIAWGVCNHAFHLHCIARWLKQRSVCPLDNSPWEYNKYGQ